MIGLAILLAIGLALVLIAGAFAIIRAVSRPPRKTFAHALAQNLPTEPSELARTGQALTLRLHDGTTTPAYLIAGDQPTGPTVLILHGFGDSLYGALTRIDLLAPYAARLLVFDQRGHGESTAKHCIGAEHEARDTLHIIDQLDDDRFVLFGYSMGAQIAINAAAQAVRQNDPRILGVIADGPYQRWRDPIAGTLRVKHLPPFPFVHLAQLLIAIRLGRAIFFNRAADAATLQCPLLILHGQNDPICPLHGAQNIAQAAPDATLVTFEEGTHLDLATLDPDRYQHALATFFHHSLTHQKQP